MPAGHPESYRSVITREVVEPLGLDRGAVHGPDGRADGIAGRRRGLRATRIAAAGGVDLQLLGIGTDGHIGFNEPAPRSHRSPGSRR